MSSVTPGRATLIAFLGVVVLGGFNGIAITYSNAELAPLWGATVRFGLASALLFALVALRRVPLPRGQALVASLLYGLLGFGVTYACAYIGIRGTGAGLAQVLLALVPLLTLILAVVIGLERFSLQGVFGTVVAVAGIVIAFGDRVATDVPLPSVLTLLAGAAAIASASVIVKRFPRSHPLSNNAVAMGVGALLLLGLSVIGGEPMQLPTDPSSIVAIGYLVVVGSIVVFMLYLFVIERWSASATSYSLLAMPLVTLPAAALIRNEPVTLAVLAGATLVLAGVYIGAFGPSVGRPLPGLLRRAPARMAPAGATAGAPAGASAGSAGPPSVITPNCP